MKGCRIWRGLGFMLLVPFGKNHCFVLGIRNTRCVLCQPHRGTVVCGLPVLGRAAVAGVQGGAAH